MTKMTPMAVMFFAIASLNQACFASRVEERLMNTILKDYNKRARPVEKETDVVRIVLDIALPQVMKVIKHAKINQRTPGGSNYFGYTKDSGQLKIIKLR